MKLGYTPFNAGVLDLEAAYRLAAELELDFIELVWDLQELDPRSQPMDRVRELSRASGVGVTLHLPFVDVNIASLMPGVRENSVARVRRGLEYGAEVGALVAVLHTGLVPVRDPRILAMSVGALSRSLSEFEPLVPIGLENLALTSHDLLRGYGELEALTLAAGQGFGNTLDFGHAFVEGATLEPWEDSGPGGAEAGEWRLASYQSGLSRVIHLHLHDNDGSADQHRTLGAGKIGWARHRDYLRSFSGTAALEIARDLEGVRESVTVLRDLLA